MSEFEEVCMQERGYVLEGRYAHFCYDWDGMTVDETTHEFLCCHCTFDPPELEADKKRVQDAMRVEPCVVCKGEKERWQCVGNQDGRGYVTKLLPCDFCNGTGLRFP